MLVREARGLKCGCGTLLMSGDDSVRVCINGTDRTGAIRGSSTRESRLELTAVLA